MFKVLNNFKKRRTNNNEIQLVEIDEHRQRKQTTPSPPRDKKKFSLRHIITPKRKRKPTTNETNENPFSTKNLPNMNSPGSCGVEPYTAKSQTLHFERKPLSPIRYNLFDNKQFMSPQSPAAKMLHQNYLRQFGPPCENAPLQMINNDIPIPSTPPSANRTVPVPNTAPTKHYKQQRRKVKGIQAMPMKPIIDKKFTLGKRKVYSSDEESRDDEESREDEDDDGFSDPDENDTFATIAPSSNFGELFLPSFIQPQKKTYSYCLRVYLIAGRSLLNTEVGFKDLSNPYLTLQVGDWRQTSTVANSTLFPTYNQTFTFLINSYRVPRKQHESYHQVDHQDQNFDDPDLILRVFDHDNIFDHSFMGRKIIPLNSLLREAQLNNKSTVYNQWVQLEGVPTGEIHLVMMVESGVNFGF
jgi:hypothetical protein